MGTMKWRHTGAGKALRAVVVAGMVALVWSSTSLALASRTGPTPAAKDMTILDPFTLKTIVPSTSGLAPAPALRDAPGIIRNPNPRRPIRIPSRVPVRSGCRPEIDP